MLINKKFPFIPLDCVAIFNHIFVHKQHFSSTECAQIAFQTPLEYFIDFFHWKYSLNGYHYICYKLEK